MIWRRTENKLEVGTVTLYEKRLPLIPLFKRFWPKRTRYRVLLAISLLAIAVVLGPYVYSRAASSSRALQWHAVDVAIPVATDTTERPAIRVACYNIAHGRGLSDSNWKGGSADERMQRLDSIADLLIEIDADIVVLNEVDFDASWSGSIDQAHYLAKHAGYPYIAKLSNLDFCIAHRSWRFGNAVLSRYPIKDAQEIDLPGYKRWETVLAGKKRALFCEVEMDGQTVGVVAVHLSHRSERLRADSAQRLLAFAKGYRNPLILAGDFNSAPTGFPANRTDQDGRNAMDLFDASGTFQRLPAVSPTEPSSYTFRSDEPTRVIDWILISDSLVIDDYVVWSSELSDHRPVVADVLLSE